MHDMSNVMWIWVPQ